MGSLTQGALSVTLSDDFEFPDEFNWRDIQQTKSFSVTGALMVEIGVKQTGREITLQGSDQHAWMTRAQLATLQSMLVNPGTNMTLVFRGITYTVRFDCERGALEARPVADFDAPLSTDFSVVTLRFYEI